VNQATQHPVQLGHHRLTTDFSHSLARANHITDGFQRAHKPAGRRAQHAQCSYTLHCAGDAGIRLCLPLPVDTPQVMPAIGLHNGMAVQPCLKARPKSHDQRGDILARIEGLLGHARINNHSRP